MADIDISKIPAPPNSTADTPTDSMANGNYDVIAWNVFKGRWERTNLNAASSGNYVTENEWRNFGGPLANESDRLNKLKDELGNSKSNLSNLQTKREYILGLKNAALKGNPLPKVIGYNINVSNWKSELSKVDSLIKDEQNNIDNTINNIKPLDSFFSASESKKTVTQRLKDAKKDLERAKNFGDSADIKAANNKLSEITKESNTVESDVAKAKLDSSKSNFTNKNPKPFVNQKPVDNKVTISNTDQTDPYLKSLTIVDTNGSLSIKNTDAKPVYFIPVKPNNIFPGQKVEINSNQYTTLASAREAYLKSIGPNGIDNLKKSLLASGYINSTQYKTNDYIAGLDASINDFSVTSLQGYQFENKKDFGTIESFIASQQKKSGINLTKTTSNIDFSTRTESDTLVNGYFNGLLGRSATQNERDQYFKELHAAENKAVANQTITRDTEGAARSVVNVGSVLTDTDRLVIAGKIAKPYLTGTNIDKVISGGGTAAQNIRDMEAYGNAYGIKLDPAMALNYVADSLTPGSSFDKQKERIRQTSMTMYKNLKDHISGGGTVADIAQQYQRSKMNILELPASQADVMDSDIQNALHDPKGLMSITDYNLSLYKDPRYRFTAGAHDRAAQMANSILQSFGLVG